MKKLSILLLACAMTLAYVGASAQCTINTGITTPGFFPTSLPCIQQGTLYGQSVQIHIPATYQYGATMLPIDSVHLISITNMPAGISYTPNPASGTIVGGGNGCIWFSGTTTAATGTYVLLVRAAITIGGVGTIDTTLGSLGYGDTLQVCGAAVGGCDTISNLSSLDTLTLFTANAGGYLAGNNGYGDLEKAEEFRGPIGSQVTGAFLGFGYASILAADSATPVTINVYDATGTSGLGTAGAPGNTIATTTVTLRQIAAAITAQSELYVSFASAPTLTAHNFFISVVLPTTGDTIALLTNLGDNGDGNGWESDAGGGGWFPYSIDWGFFPNSMGNDIQAITCGGAPVANFESSVLDNLLSNCTVPATMQFYNTSYNGVNSISWSFAGGTPSTSTSANPSVSYSAAGSYTVVLTAVGTSATDTIVSTVNIYPTVTATTSTTPATGPTLANGTATAVGTTGVAPYTYAWSAAPQDTFATAGGLIAGSYTVTVIDADGCGVVETAVVALVNGILNIGANTVNIYPSPATDVLHIDWSAATIADIRITDMSGQEMLQTTTENNLRNAININGLAAGTYILTIRDRTSGAAQSVKFVKM